MMPERLDADGFVEVEAIGDDYLELRVENAGLRMSRYNAARLWGILGLFLGVPLPEWVKLQGHSGDPTEYVYR